MKHSLLRIVFLLVLVVAVSSCGRTIYRAKYVKSNKFVRAKKRYHFWHKHGAQPRAHGRGYW